MSLCEVHVFARRRMDSAGGCCKPVGGWLLRIPFTTSRLADTDHLSSRDIETGFTALAVNNTHLGDQQLQQSTMTN